MFFSKLFHLAVLCYSFSPAITRAITLAHSLLPSLPPSFLRLLVATTVPSHYSSVYLNLFPPLQHRSYPSTQPSHQVVVWLLMVLMSCLVNFVVDTQ